VRSLRPGEEDARRGGLTSGRSRRKRAAEPGGYESDVRAFAAETLIVMRLSADDGIICKIIAGGVPVSVVYRDEKKL